MKSEIEICFDLEKSVQMLKMLYDDWFKDNYKMFVINLANYDYPHLKISQIQNYNFTQINMTSKNYIILITFAQLVKTSSSFS